MNVCILYKLYTCILNTCLQFKKNIYTDKTDDIVNKHNNTYHRAIKGKPNVVKPSMYIDLYK